MSPTISSMTGFARVEAAHGSRSWIWELKSVNGRGLELRSRMPQGFDSLEPLLRKSLQRVLKRGSVNANLALRSDTTNQHYQVNEVALKTAIEAVESVGARLKCALPQAESILALRGVMELADAVESEEDRQALMTALLDSFDEAVDALAASRAAEGNSMAEILAAQFGEIERLCAAASKSAAAAPEALRTKISAQLAELLSGAELPEERLAQEAALLAVKADVREELDRLFISYCSRSSTSEQ